MWCRHFVLWFVIASVSLWKSYGTAASDDDAQLSFAVDHSLKSNNGRRVFTPRGTLNYRDPRVERDEGVKGNPLSMSKFSLSGDQLESFKALVDQNSTYAVRVKTPGGVSVIAYTLACALVTSQFREEWEVTMDQFGNIAAINYSPSHINCAGASTTAVEEPAEFHTSVKLLYPWRGIRPEVKPGQGGMPPAGSSPAGAKGEPTNNDEPTEEPSMLRKYWMYIAIAVVFLMMNNLPEEAANTPGGARPGGPKPPPRRRPTSGS